MLLLISRPDPNFGFLQAQTRFEHQLALTEHHLALAAEFCRPVSLHCVQSYGHLSDMLRRCIGLWAVD